MQDVFSTITRVSSLCHLRPTRNCRTRSRLRSTLTNRKLIVTKSKKWTPPFNPHTLGSPEWLAEAFGSGPARDVRGRSRPTQRYIGRALGGEASVAEGGNAAIARTLLTAAILAGQVKRIKMEPFQLLESDHGVHAIPDTLFERADGRVFVVEAKSDRFLTDEKLDKCRAVEKVVNAAGMTYLFWTDRWPLSPSLWQLMLELRRCGTSSVSEDRIQEIAERLSTKPMAMSELRELDLYRAYVLAAAWRGLAHFNLFAPLTDATVVSNDARDRGMAQIFTAPVDTKTFFRSLTRHG